MSKNSKTVNNQTNPEATDMSFDSVDLLGRNPRHPWMSSVSTAENTERIVARQRHKSLCQGAVIYLCTGSREKLSKEDGRSIHKDLTSMRR